MTSLSSDSSNSNKINHGNQNDTIELWDEVVSTLNDPNFQSLSSRFDRTAMMKWVNALGGAGTTMSSSSASASERQQRQPPQQPQRMMLLHSDALDDLGRIPRSSEGYAVDAVEAVESLGAGICEVFMVSHKWLRPRTDPLDATTGFPDTACNKKAKAISEFTKWRKAWVQKVHGFAPQILYWIDYSCFDQDHLGQGIPYLPLWVACCERFLQIDHPEFDSRAWCRLEPLLASAYSFADHHTIIDEDFVNCWPYTGSASNNHLKDPRLGDCTDPNDMDKILPLIDQAEYTLLKRIRIQRNRQGLPISQSSWPYTGASGKRKRSMPPYSQNHPRTEHHNQETTDTLTAGIRTTTAAADTVTTTTSMYGSEDLTVKCFDLRRR